MTFAAALTSVICFALAFQRLAIASVAGRTLHAGREAVRVMTDAKVSDEAKERIARTTSLMLMRGFWSLASRSGAAIAASLLPLVVLDIAGVVRMSAVNRLLTSWNGLLLACGALTLIHVVRARSERR